MSIRQRLNALESKDSSGHPHVVLWTAGQSFADVLSVSSKHAGATSRLLIELAFVGDGPLTPEHLAEQVKAHAWADELEAV
ncbi:MAG: hypothetical protein KA312_02055 [Sphingorhabdus sp.]|nr:hypothetical protein [Sphingorhabdus sp.]